MPNEPEPACIAPIDTDRALSLTQPWAYAITHLGKRIENRLAWRGCKHRGPIWLHASATKGRAFEECADGLARVLVSAGRKVERDAMLEGPTPLLKTSHGYYSPGSITMGAIVARATIVDVIENERDFTRWVDAGGERDRSERIYQGQHWWFRGFALVLDDVIEIDPVPAKGALGLWRVPETIADAAHEAFRARLAGISARARAAYAREDSTMGGPFSG